MSKQKLLQHQWDEDSTLRDAKIAFHPFRGWFAEYFTSDYDEISDDGDYLDDEFLGTSYEQAKMVIYALGYLI